MAPQVKAPEAPVSAEEIIGRVAHGFIASSALGAAVRLNVADALGDGKNAIGDLAKGLGVNADALARCLRLLSSLGVFEETADGVFANNDASSQLRADHPQSQKDMVAFLTDPFHFKSYADMVPTIRDGKTAAEHVWGKPCFEVFADQPDEQKRFDDAMTNISSRAVPMVLESYDFSDIGTLVDVAGGHGMLLSSILDRYPNMNGKLLDLAHVVPGAQKRMQSMNLAARCEVVAGDFFKSVPSGDAIIMKHIIHDWDDDKGLLILKHCRTALGGKKPGKLLLVEFVLSGRNELDPSKFMDIEMLMMPGGRERTEAQFAQLFACAGFKLTKVIRTKSPLCIIEAECA